MAFPKNALFSEEDQTISRISSALSHPARLFIARTLKEEGPMYVFQLEKKMPLTQGSISFHLDKMRNEGLIDVEERGLFNLYILNLDRLRETQCLYERWYAELGVGHVNGTEAPAGLLVGHKDA